MSTATQSQSRASPKRAASASTTPLFKLAWRNIWRQKRRTILLLIVVAYATLTTVFLWGMVDGTNASVLANQARFLQAPVLISTETYRSDPDPENALQSLEFLREVESVPGVLAAAPRLELPALLRSPYTSEIALVRGVDPALEPSVSDIPNEVTQGQMLTKPGEIVLGVDIAENLDVRLGERLALDVSSVAGPQAAGLIVVGIIDSGLAAIDMSSVLIHIDDARTLTGIDTATGVALDVPRGEETRVAEAVQGVLPAGAKAFDLLTLLGPLNNELEANRVQMIPMMLIFAIFAALAVTSTLLVSVLERKREFGMIASIGLAPGKLSRMVIMESVLLTTAGWVLGLILGYFLTWLFGVVNILGPLFSASSEAFSSFGLGSEMYTTSRPEYALYAGITILFAALFAVLIPARRVAKLEPVEAMRDE